MAGYAPGVRPFPYRGGMTRRLVHQVWRSGARDTVCGRDVFKLLVTSTHMAVTCALCLRIAGLAAKEAGQHQSESA